MPKFTDSQGSEWQFDITVADVKRVKNLTGTELVSLLESSLLERLAADPILLCDVIYVLCKPEADARGITDEQFGTGMKGDAIDGATAALLQGLADFFPSRRRVLLVKALEKVRKLEDLSLAAAARTLDSPVLEELLAQELSPEKMEAELRSRLAELRTSGEQSTSTPERSASTPGPSPTGS